MKRRKFLGISLACLGLPAFLGSKSKKEDNVIEFLEKNIKFLSWKLKKLIPWKATKHHRELLEIFNNDRVMVKKYRQGGFSTFAMLWCLYQMIHKPNYRCGIISKTQRESQNFSKMLHDCMAEMPKETRPYIKRADNYRTEFDNGSSITFLTPIELIGRQFDVAVLDEVAFLDYGSTQYLNSTLQYTPKVFAISTPYMTCGWFYETWTKKNEYVKYCPNYLEHPDYQDKEWLTQMKNSLGPRGVKQELLAEFSGEYFE